MESQRNSEESLDDFVVITVLADDWAPLGAIGHLQVSWWPRSGHVYVQFQNMVV